MSSLNPQCSNLEAKKISLQNKPHSQRMNLLLSLFFLHIPLTLQAPTRVRSSLCQAVLAHRLENNSCPQISTIRCQRRGSLALCLFQDKRCRLQGEIHPFRLPTAKQRLSLMTPRTHLHTLPFSKVYVPCSCPPARFCSQEVWVRGPPPAPWAQGDPAWLPVIFREPHLPLSGWARHKPQVPWKVSAALLFPVCQADSFRVYFWSIKAIRGLKW